MTDVAGAPGRTANQMEGNTREATGQEWRLMTTKMLITGKLGTP